MSILNRREFISSVLLTVVAGKLLQQRVIMTVTGPIPARRLGLSLIHEHILVDFIGADKISPSRWLIEDVVKKALPFLREAKGHGVKSFFDCTPSFLGRDVQLLKRVSIETGLQVITNTGYYGAVQNKYLPAWAFMETADELARRWINEFEYGIENTIIKPGFIKIGVDSAETLSPLHRKLVEAAAITHLKTGLTICSHTGPAAPAFEELAILKNQGVKPDAFVWVHAQAEKDKSKYLVAAKQGCWISLDAVAWGETEEYVDAIIRMKAAGYLNRLLISHDAGWYKPGEPEADFRGYSNIFTQLLPALFKKGLSKKDQHQLLIRNPAEAMSIHIRKL